MSLKKSGYVVLVLLGISGLLSRLALAAVELNASGSTFIYPIESKWANIYERIDPSLRINYQPNGSGGGIGQLLQGMTDFAGSDAPLSDKQLAGARGDVLHFPAALGADVVAYNLPEIVPPARLRLTGPVVADIFLGKIMKWNDPAIVELNPKLKLPNREILTIIDRTEAARRISSSTIYQRSVQNGKKLSAKGPRLSGHWDLMLRGIRE
jgi:phosphate transport system substrate-binding protein